MKHVTLIRVFLSSPGDVAEERAAARALIDQELAKKPAFAGRIAFEVVSWDEPAARIGLLANETPQESVNRARPRPAACDIVVVILWSRMGTPLPDTIRKRSGDAYLSGTEWEFEDAMSSSFEPRPQVLVYRRTEEPTVRLLDPDRAEKEQQFKTVLGFVEAIEARKCGTNPYRTPVEFKALLHQHLEQLAWERLKQAEAPRDSGRVRAADPAREELGPTIELLDEKKGLIQKFFYVLGTVLVLAAAAAIFVLTRPSIGQPLNFAVILTVVASSAVGLGYCGSCDNGCSTVRTLLLRRRWREALEMKQRTLCLMGVSDGLFARAGADRADQ